MEAVAEHELSVVLSSHLVSDLERVCDHLVVLVDSRVRVDGRRRRRCSATHHRLTGPRRDPATLPADQHVVSASHTDRQSHARRPHRRARSSTRPGRSARSSLEDLVLAYMSGRRRRARPARAPGGAPMIWLTWRQFRGSRPPRLSSPSSRRRGRARGHRAARWPTSPPARDVFDHLDRATTAGSSTPASSSSRVAPALIGVFWGAPLVARELEAGTHRLVWTQSVTRTRWLATKLGLTAARGRGRDRACSPSRSPGGPRRWTARTSSTHGSLPARLTPVVVRACAASSRSGTPCSRSSLGVAVGRGAAPVAAGDGGHPRGVRLRADRGAALGPPAPDPAGRARR